MENNIINENNNETIKEELKWLKIKTLLKDKSILENSINEIQKEKLTNLPTKLFDIYKRKIMIHLLIEKNEQLLSTWKNKEKNMNNNILNLSDNNIIITRDIIQLYSGPEEHII